MERSTEHKEGKAGVKAIYFPSKTLADGSHPFMLRITKDRQRKYISTGISLHPNFWNKETNTFRKSLPVEKRKAIEVALRKWEEKYDEAATTLAEHDQKHDAGSIVTKISEERKNSRKFKLLSYFDELIKQFEKTGNIGNRKVYKDVQNKLQSFIGEGNDVAFDQITVKFCNEWEVRMRADGLKETTLSVKFRTLRAVVNKAIANGYAKSGNYPFARNSAEIYKFHTGKFNTKTKKRALSKEVIKYIEAYEPKQDLEKYASLRNSAERIQLAKDIFLFSYYCGGINFVDIATLKVENIQIDLNRNPRLNYRRKKNKIDFSIPLIEPAFKILKKYQNEQHNQYIFPILNSNTHKTNIQIHNRCNKILCQVNHDLKIIGKDLGIDAPLTSYVARHSFGTVLKRSGVSTSIISEWYKHSDERTTKIYLDDFDTTEIDIVFNHLI